MASTIRQSLARRIPIGVELSREGGAHARVWAPLRSSVELVTYSGGGRVSSITPLTAEGDGYFSGFAAELTAGIRYRFRLDRGDAFPEPCSRFQPDGPHGPSEVVDPNEFRWTDDDRPGITIAGQVIYEVHIGTFTPEGTFRAAIDKLDTLVDTGFTCLEIMPIADFPGRFGWGYDGVNLYAPSRLYGRPDDLRAFVDAAHARGLGVILDVVYNHLGPDGNYLQEFSPDYFTDKYENDWGRAINFEGPPPARGYFVQNARYWIDEFHFDGLRLDATQQVFDSSTTNVLRQITDAGRRSAQRR